VTLRWRSFAQVLSIIALIGSVSTAQPPQSGRSVGDGVFTEQQAVRGQMAYRARCASCHGNNLTGRAGPPLAGDDFLIEWSGRPLLDLVNKIRRTMPKGDSEPLSEGDTLDVVAYVLQEGKFPSGNQNLALEEAALAQVTFPVRQAPAGTAASAPQLPALAVQGNVAQVMRGILFPSANILFTVQSIDPGAKKEAPKEDTAVGFDWLIWGGNIYPAWEVVDYAAIALGESASLMLAPGRRCENGKPVPVDDPDWIKFSGELAEAGKAGFKASQTRNQEIVSEFTNQLNDSCQNCHRVFRGRTHCVKP